MCKASEVQLGGPMSENLLKVALMKKMQTVIEYQEIYAELNEGLFKLVRQVAEYYERQGLEIPERQQTTSRPPSRL
jgi:hypothetical protein